MPTANSPLLHAAGLLFLGAAASAAGQTPMLAPAAPAPASAPSGTTPPVAGAPKATTPEVKALDLTVLHYFVLEKVLGVTGPEAQRQWPGIAYVRNFPECLTRVDRGEARAAFITNEVTMAEVEAVCHSGSVMPPKSTFFYPKTIGGFLFSSIQEAETSAPFYAAFRS